MFVHENFGVRVTANRLVALRVLHAHTTTVKSGFEIGFIPV